MLNKKSRYLIYVKPNCGFSEKAKSLAKTYKIKHDLVEITEANKKNIYRHIDNLTNKYRLFPIVFKDDIFIGGYTELNKDLEQKDGVLIIPKGISTKTTSFDGSPWYSLCAMKYLSNKHKNDCIVIPGNFNNLNKPYKQSEISLRWNENKQKIIAPKDFWKYFNKCRTKNRIKKDSCSGQRFIVFPFGYSCNSISHSNYILYDSKNKIMERFEPYGSVENFIDAENMKCLMVNIDKEIEKLFLEKMGAGFIKKYYKPLDYGNKIGFQMMQETEINEIKQGDPKGFCTAWCVWYADLRLLNKNINRKTLINLAAQELKNQPESLTSFIRNYCEYLTILQKIYL